MSEDLVPVKSMDEQIEESHGGILVPKEERPAWMDARKKQNTPITVDEYRYCHRILEEARSHLLDSNLYLSHAVAMMGNPRLTRELPTAAVASNGYGGIYFLFNPDFLIWLYEEEGVDAVAYILCHETMHLLGLHVGSHMREKNKSLWNICADVVVNTWLNESGYFKVSDRFKKMCWDAQKVDLQPHTVLKHLDVESIYEDILQDVKKQAEMLQQALEMGWGNSDGTLDSHDEMPDIPDPVMEELAKNLEKAGYHGKDKQDANSKSWGNTPDGAIRIFDRLHEVFDWERTLMRFIGSVIKRRNTWERRNRKVSVCFPGLLLPAEEIRIDHRIVVYGDMSGSIDADTVARFVDIIKQAPSNVKMECYTFDTRIYSWDIHDQPRGGGGTDFQAVVNHAETLGPSDAYIVLTDGYCSEPRVKLAKKWLWLTTHQSLSPNCGRWIPIGRM